MLDVPRLGVRILALSQEFKRFTLDFGSDDLLKRLNDEDECYGHDKIGHRHGYLVLDITIYNLSMALVLNIILVSKLS